MALYFLFGIRERGDFLSIHRRHSEIAPADTRSHRYTGASPGRRRSPVHIDTQNCRAYSYIVRECTSLASEHTRRFPPSDL